MIGLGFLGAIENDGQHTPLTAEFKLGKKETITLPTSILKDVELVPTSWPNTAQSRTSKPIDTKLLRANLRCGNSHCIRESGTA